MGLTTQPDAGAALHGAAVVWPTFEPSSMFFALPTGLVIAADRSGVPDFRLVLVASGGVRGIGLLEVGVRVVTDLAAALIVARGARHDAIVVEAPMCGGFGRIRIAGGRAMGWPDLAPAALMRGGAGSWRLSCELEPEPSAMLAQAMREGTLAARLFVEMEMDAVAVRATGRARLNPRRTLEALWTLAGASGTLDRGAALARLRTDPTALGITLESTDTTAAVAEALLDRLRVRFGRPGASASDVVTPAFNLISIDSERDGQLTFDLNEPVLTRRGWVASLDPVAEARRLGRSLAECVKEITTPAVDTGLRRLLVRSSLEGPVLGLHRAVATIRIPASPPHRPQELVHSVEVGPNLDEQQITVRLAPGEELRYEISGMAVIGEPPRRVSSSSRSASSRFVRIGRDDTGARIIEIDASPSLRGQARIRCTLSPVSGGRSSMIIGEVPESGPLVVAVDPELGDAVLDVEASDPTSGRVARVSGLPVTDAMMLDLSTMPQHGPRTIEFTPSVDRAAVECEIELEDGARHHAVLSGSAVRITYASASIFAARWRIRHRPLGWSEWSPWSAWSEEATWSPGSIGAGAGTNRAKGGDAMVVDGAFVYVEQEQPLVARFVPAAPTLASGVGRVPTVLSIDMGPERGLVQFETRWEVSAETSGRMKAAIAAERGVAADAVDLQPAVPVSVRVAVLVRDGDELREVISQEAQTTAPFPSPIRLMGANADIAPVRRAFAGESGLAFVRYTAALIGVPVVSARLRGHVTTTAGDRARAIDAAIRSGALTLDLTLLRGAAAELVEEAERRVRALAASTSVMSGSIDVAQTLEAESLVITRWCDLAKPSEGMGDPPAWWRPEAAPRPLSEWPAESVASIALAAELSGAPLELVEVKLGPARATLTPQRPRAEFAEPVASSELDLRMTMLGGRVVERRVAIARGRAVEVTASHLGLLAVTIDGSGLSLGDGAAIGGTLAYASVTGEQVASVTFALEASKPRAVCWLPIAAQAPGDSMIVRWTQQRGSAVTQRSRQLPPTETVRL